MNLVTLLFSFQFDPLTIESKKAATVVLMLNSPEEEILAKACEAIYKFALKGLDSFSLSFYLISICCRLGPSSLVCSLLPMGTLTPYLKAVHLPVCFTRCPRVSHSIEKLGYSLWEKHRSQAHARHLRIWEVEAEGSKGKASLGYAVNTLVFPITHSPTHSLIQSTNKKK